MVWVIRAAILNTIWTLWCIRLLPPRVAVRFGANGQAEGWISRKGFALFSILFPLAQSAFILYIGRVTQSVQGMTTAMEHLAAGMILFFSFLSWCIVRSNRRRPARIDFVSLMASLVFLTGILIASLSGLSKTSHPPKPTTAPISSSKK